MFDPIQSQSIQRWEYEGGRLLPRRNGPTAGSAGNKWIPGKGDLSLKTPKSSARLSQSVMPVDRRKPNWIQTINNFAYETEIVSSR